jgi:hypothetical protein
LFDGSQAAVDPIEIFLYLIKALVEVVDEGLN